MKDKIIPINIFVGDKIINKNNVPIIYYWNGKHELIGELKSNKEFMQFIKDNCITFDNYGKSHISYLILDIDDESNYKTYDNKLQIWFNLKDDDTKLKFEFIKYYFNYIYKCSYKTDFTFSENLLDKDIILIYEAIKKKNGDKVSKNIILNYIRSELMDKNSLNQENIEHVIDIIKNILKEEK